MFRSQRFLHPLGEQVKQRGPELTGKQEMPACGSSLRAGSAPSSFLTLSWQLILQGALTGDKTATVLWLFIIQEVFGRAETLLGTTIFLHTL